MDGYNFAAYARRGVGIKNFRPSNDNIEAQLALGMRLVETAHRLRYVAYRSYGYIADHPDGLFSDTYDIQPNCRTALVFKRGVPAATVRVSVHDPDGSDVERLRLQAMEIFGNEIKTTMSALCLNNRSPRVMEIAKLARSPEYCKDIDVVFALYRTAAYLILHHDIDIVFNAIRPHHIPMYRRFGFQQLTDPRQYPGLGFKTALMACFRPNFAHSRDNLPFLKGISKDDASYAGLIAGERVTLFGTPWRDEPTPNHTAPHPDRPPHHRTGAADQRIGL